jgi:hypothetical protein
MGTDNATVIQTLASYGSKLGDFVQGERIEEGGISAHQEGFCRGVCLDWTRKVLLGGKPTFSNPNRAAAQTRRHATIQTVFEGQDKLQNELVAVQEELIHLYKTVEEDDIVLPQQLLDKIKKYIPQLRIPSDRTYHVSLVDKMIDWCGERANKCNHRTDTGWAALAHAIDAYHLKRCDEELRHAPTRSFNHIKILVVVTAEVVWGRNCEGRTEPRVSIAGIRREHCFGTWLRTRKWRRTRRGRS